MKKFAVISREQVKTKSYKMLSGDVTFYAHGRLYPFSLDKALESFCYDTKEKAYRALNHAKKVNFFGNYAGYENLANTFEVVEVEF